MKMALLSRYGALCTTIALVFICVLTIVDDSEQNKDVPKIPKNVWKELQRCESNADFINRFVSKKPPEGMDLQPVDQLLFSNDTETGSFNQEGVETIAGMLAEADGCSPREMTVTIPVSDDANIIYWPTCTKIQRCGGCCGTEMLACAPTKTDTQSIEVMQVKYTSDGNFEYSGLVSLSLERHLECDCNCRVHVHNCNPQKHDYDEHSCSCKCRNAADALSCPSQKKWDEKECACVCPKIFNCLDDEYFSFSTCSCQRGTPQSAQVVTTANPCAGKTCRVGYVASPPTCTCKVQQVTGGRTLRSVEHRSSIRGRPWSTRNQHPWDI